MALCAWQTRGIVGNSGPGQDEYIGATFTLMQDSTESGRRLPPADDGLLRDECKESVGQHLSVPAPLEAFSLWCIGGVRSLILTRAFIEAKKKWNPTRSSSKRPIADCVRTIVDCGEGVASATSTALRCAQKAIKYCKPLK